MQLRSTALIGAVVLSACASTKPTQARQDVADLVAERGGPSDVITADVEQWNQAQVDLRVNDLLAKPLSVDRAIQVALLNNRGLLSTMESVGVAQADLVNAGLLQNPTLGGDVVFSTRGNGLGGGIALSQSILSAFLVPAKRKIAKAQLQMAILGVGDATLATIRDVRVAHAHAHATLAEQDLHRTLVQMAEVADELAQRQHDAGNLTVLQREQAAAALDEARLELSAHQVEVAEAREELNRLLGLWGKQITWTLDDGAELPAEPLDLHGLEALGIEQRLDISAARFEVESVERALKLRRQGIIPQIEAGVEAGNEVGDDEGHEWVVGPSLSIELPIFNPGHADLAKIRAQLRQAQHHLQHMAIDARADIRLHREQLVNARRQVEYLRDVVVPRQERISARALEQYNGMLMGVYDLLEIQAGGIEARLELADAVRGYWVARAELERAVGGGLTKP